MPLNKLDDDEKGTTLIRTLGGEQEVLTINEPGLYRLTISSFPQFFKETINLRFIKPCTFSDLHGFYAAIFNQQIKFCSRYL